MPLLCELSVFRLKGVRPPDQAKRLFDGASVLEPGKDMGIRAPKISGRLLNILEVATLDFYWNAWRCRCMTWTWRQTARFVRRPSLRDSVVDRISRKAIRARRAFKSYLRRQGLYHRLYKMGILKY